MPRKILTVEDDDAIRRAIVDSLRFAGHDVIEAGDGETGLRCATRQDYDLLLLDLVLPGTGGLDILKAVRELRPTQPVIILSARGEESDRVEGLRLGADDYVVKPFSVKELLARAEAVLRRSPERPSDIAEVAVPRGTVDLQRREWQHVRIPMERHLVTQVRLATKGGGRYYLDDLHLAGPKVLPVVVAVRPPDVAHGEEADVWVRVVGPDEGSSPRVQAWLEIAPEESVLLLGDGRQYSGKLACPTGIRTGWQDVIVAVEDASGRVMHERSRVRVWPSEDLPIYADGVADGWEPKLRLAKLENVSDPARGSAAAAFTFTRRGAGAGFSHSAPHRLSPFGYRALSGWLHLGEATVSELAITLGRLQVSITDQIDLAEGSWQPFEVALPRGVLGVADAAITEVTFGGEISGTLYVDDMRLIAARPPTPVTAVLEGKAAVLPRTTVLSQNYPNPFNSSTTIQFTLPQPETVELAIYNLAGQQVTTLAQGKREAGTYTLRWDGRDDARRELASGVYLYRLQAGQQVETRKLLLMK